MESTYILHQAAKWNMTDEQLGLKSGILAGTIFPIMAVVVFGILSLYGKRRIVQN
ncbi:hypothetical protein [Lachnotalea glycerini]|nr:hypothetical protein [Lachnotalea glycerini]